MPPHVPIRSCVACRKRTTKQHLIRLYRDQSGIITADLSGTAPARGAYLCQDPRCLARAVRKGLLQRALRATAPPEGWETVMRLVAEWQALKAAALAPPVTAVETPTPPEESIGSEETP